MSKISLCMIVGNVETYIERCLESFKPIADEICIVRAIGCAVPDKTLDIARDKFGAKVGEYHNHQGHEDWPHVDDFAAARQQSYDMATGEYCFWADSDDVLESGAEIVRELADRAEYPCFIFPYRIFGRGLVVPRERMMLKRSGRWKHRVHECFDFTIKPIPGIEDQRVVVTHRPEMNKTGSNDRNLRILQSIPPEEMTAGLTYHLHGEYMAQHKITEAIETARKALADPTLGKPERVEIFLNLAMLSEHDLEIRKQYLHQAYAADPTRREALALLASSCMDLGQNVDALAYSRQMMATPRPPAEAWNSRVDVYDWIGSDVAQQALRANGMDEKAEALRLQTFQQAGGQPRITLIHATRGRPQQAAQCRKLWLSLAEKPALVEHMFLYDEDDPDSRCLSRMHAFCLPKGGGCVAAWNMGAFYARGEVLIQLSDDWVPVPQWDKLILERIGDVSKPKVLAISDGHRKDALLCMAICTRSYWMQDYYIFHPSFTGVYSDNEFTERAHARGQVIEAKDIVFTHEHPIFTHKPADKTYQEQNAPHRYREGKEVYDYLKLGTDWSTVQGWFNYWPFYRKIAQQLDDGDTICEVGTWLGRSIIFMAQELKRLKKKVRIVAVDSFQGELNQPAHQKIVQDHGGSIRAAFDENCRRCGVADMIEVLQGNSWEMAAKVPDGSLAFIYVDAAHDYESAKKDIAAWTPKVAPTGLMAGHDAQHEPVMRAVKEAFGKPLVLGPVWVAKDRL